jgi:hypothetical protein
MCTKTERVSNDNQRERRIWQAGNSQRPQGSTTNQDNSTYQTNTDRNRGQHSQKPRPGGRLNQNHAQDNHARKAALSRLSKEDAQKRRAQGSCYNFGKKGHQAKTCSDQPKGSAISTPNTEEDETLRKGRCERDVHLYFKVERIFTPHDRQLKILILQESHHRIFVIKIALRGKPSNSGQRFVKIRTDQIFDQFRQTLSIAKVRRHSVNLGKITLRPSGNQQPPQAMQNGRRTLEHSGRVSSKEGVL